MSQSGSKRRQNLGKHERQGPLTGARSSGLTAIEIRLTVSGNETCGKADAVPFYEIFSLRALTQMKEYATKFEYFIYIIKSLF